MGEFFMLNPWTGLPMFWHILVQLF